MNDAEPSASPATNLQFKFIKIAADGSVTWQGASNHIYTVPNSGTGFVRR